MVGAQVQSYHCTSYLACRGSVAGATRTAALGSAKARSKCACSPVPSSENIRVSFHADRATGAAGSMRSTLRPSTRYGAGT